MSGPADALDPITLSSLLASRLCHDLINPIGAIGSGLEVLEEPEMDQAMKDAALDLIRSGGRKSVGLLKFARLAYGAAGGFDAEIPMDEAAAALKEVYEWAKADLDWRLPGAPKPKDIVKIILILCHAAADCVPRGGVVSIRELDGDYVIEARGPRMILQDDLVRAVRGDAEELKPKFTPAYIAGVIARSAGGQISLAVDDEKVVMRAKFADTGEMRAAR